MLNVPGSAGNRVAVGILGGVPEQLVDTVDHEVGDNVLEGLGLLMDLIPAVSQDFCQEGLDETVAAHHRDGVLGAFLGQGN